MDTLTLDKDIEIFCVRSTSFPQGIGEAHQKLQSIVPFDPKRKYFGVSAPENGREIVYRAGSDELQKGELNGRNLESFTVKKGNYIYIDVKDYMKSPLAIAEAFRKLLSDPNIDPQGCCVEWYMGNATCRCMVRLKG